MTATGIQTLFLSAILATQLVWAARMLRGSLFRRYPALFRYLTLVTVLSLAAMLVRGFAGIREYYLFFVFSRPVVWALFFTVLYECYGRMVADYSAVKRIGQLVMYGAFGSVAVVGALLVATDPYSVLEHQYWVKTSLLQEQSVYLAAAICVGMLLVFRRFFRLPTARNVRVIFGVFGFYFLGMAMLIVVRSYGGGELTHVLDMGGMSLSAICPAIGALMFSHAGEEIESDARANAAFNRSEVRKAMGRLGHVNTQLMRAIAK